MERLSLNIDVRPTSRTRAVSVLQRKSQSLNPVDLLRELEETYDLLQQRENDLETATELGQMLLEKNQDVMAEAGRVQEELALKLAVAEEESRKGRYEVDEWKQRCEQLASNYATANRSVAHQETQLEAFKDENMQMRARLEQMSRELADNVQLRERCFDAEQKVIALSNSVQAEQDLQKTVIRLQQKLAKRKSQAALATSTLDNTTEGFQDSLSQLRSKYEGRIRALKEENVHLVTQLAEQQPAIARLAIAEERIVSLNAELTQALALLADSRSTQAQLRTQVDELTVNAPVEAAGDLMQEQLFATREQAEVLEQERDTLRNQMAVMQAKLDTNTPTGVPSSSPPQKLRELAHARADLSHMLTTLAALTTRLKGGGDAPSAPGLVNELEKLAQSQTTLSQSPSSNMVQLSLEMSSIGEQLNRLRPTSVMLPDSLRILYQDAPSIRNKVGWLEKQSDHLKMWRRRWFVLSAGFLEYYRNPTVCTFILSLVDRFCRTRWHIECRYIRAQSSKPIIRTKQSIVSA
eukprot:TRINITY_DN5644_c0_g1_i2.p1 TRINITY_DN5644_c0_g1~~TRINITY_DN5644_c0_g1_i2.p1  ORF type:complete len:523 (-),score=88.17 TRINITY_DN5644_c0_g1_i2:456-2024(-)